MIGAEALSLMTGNPFSMTNAALIGGVANVASNLYAGATASSSSSSAMSNTQKKQFLYGQGEQLSGKALAQFERAVVERGEDPFEASRKAFSTDYGTYIHEFSIRHGIRDGKLQGHIHVGTIGGQSVPYNYYQLSNLYDMAAVKTAKGRDGDLIDVKSLDLSIELKQTAWSLAVSNSDQFPGQGTNYARFDFSQECAWRIVVYMSKDVHGISTNYDFPQQALAEVLSSVQVEDRKAGKVRIMHVEDVVMQTRPGGSGTFATDHDYHRIDLSLQFGEDDIAVWDVGEGGNDHTKCTRPEITVAIFQVGTVEQPQYNFDNYPGQLLSYMADTGVVTQAIGAGTTNYDQGCLRTTITGRLNYKK